MVGRTVITTGLPSKIDVVGTGVSIVSLADAAGLILDPPEEGLVVAVANVHSVMSARRSPELAEVLSHADLVTPDGMPLVWAQRAFGVSHAERVDGLRLFEASVNRGTVTGARHYFYGSTPETLAAMERRLRAAHPSIEIVGMVSPPFRELAPSERAEHLLAIRAARPTVVWVGLGMPKQELWMSRAHPELPGLSLVGIGAVFDWIAGSAKKAPRWMQDAGLEWLYRLAHDPIRMWRRYAWNNPAFLALLAVQLLRRRLRRPRV